jgi:hypothetical protein
MQETKVTPEIVEALYKQLNNKQLFLTLFGTTKFYLVTTDFLNRMYQFLISKI